MGLLDGILSNVLGNLGNRSGGVRPNDGNSQGGSVLGGIGGGARDHGSDSGNPVAGVATAAVVALALRVLQQNGGIGGLIEKFRGSGLGQQASSWVSTGDNMPVGAHQLADAIGPDEIAKLASQFGLSPEQARDGLAQVLPDVVDQMTPAGEVPDGNFDEISNALATLQRRGLG